MSGAVGTPSQADRIDRLLNAVRVMPVVVIEDEAQAVPLADALMEGGVSCIEITLRTPAALPAAERIARDRPEMVLGTGTVLTEQDLRASREAGAKFAVSPGLTPTLADAARAVPDVPLLPGCATASEVMAAMEAGLTRLKFFPAETSGGAGAVKALAGPLPAARFCPTGGITAERAEDYLGLPNVFCVGGSWVTPKDALRGGDWAAVTRLAKVASGAA